MPAILFEDLQDARVLVIRRRKNPRRFAREEDRGAGYPAAGQTADDEHDLQA